MSLSQPMRQYQVAAVDGIRKSISEGNRRVLLQLATGAGKTRIAAEILRMAEKKGTKCLFLAPRRELIHQAAQAFARQGLRPGIIMAGERSARLLPLQVASFDTLHARAIRSDRMLMPAAGLIIVDEAHLSLARSRRDILDYYKDSIIIGLTATPARGDGRGLGELYDDLVFGPSIRELTDSGHLVPLRYFAPSKPDLDGLKLNKDGDYVEKSLAGRMDRTQLIGDIVDNWLRIARNRRTVVFCVSCAHSRHVRDEFLRHGIAAEHLDGETPTDERAQILDRVRSGETQVLCNVFVASYGLDIPALDCAVLARPTKNIALYLQTVGRVMRTYPGKTDALVIDHAGAVMENGFADDFIPWSLDGEEKVKDRKAKLKKERKEPKELDCPRCHTVFRGRRDCPACGHELIAPGKPVPVHEADLHEIRRDAAKKNRDESWDAKAKALGGLRLYAREHGYKNGWAEHKYRELFGVWPNDARVRDAQLCTMPDDVRSWLKSRQIRWAHRREK